MEQRNLTISDYYKILAKNILIALLYLFVLFFAPIFAIFDSKELLPYISLIYQIFGICFLYIDEKFKMDRKKMIYGRLNTIILSISKSYKEILNSIKWIYRFLTNPPSKDCKLTFDIQVISINHDYDKINDPKEREAAQLISIEQDLMMLRYFSEVRKAGYFIMAIGFILQAFSFILIN